MGSKGATSTSTSGPPAQVLAQYQQVMDQANNVAQQPLQQYTGAQLAGFTPMQTQAQNSITNNTGDYQPSFTQANNLVGQGTQQYSPTAFSPGAISQYESPYNNQVIQSTEAQMNQNDQLQQQQLTGNSIMQGAFGGDRQAIAASTLAGQQDLANNQTIAGLENQNYSQALGQFNQANATGLSAASLNNQTALSGAGIEGALGNYTTANNLQQENAMLTAGGQQQQLAQSALNIPISQFQQQQQYPFQTTQWLGQLAEGIGANSGGTSSTTQPAGNTASSVAGLGLGIAGLFMKDGGAVDGYDNGGVISNNGFIPNWNVPLVPSAPSMSGASGSSIPKPPSINSQGGNGNQNLMLGAADFKKSMSGGSDAQDFSDQFVNVGGGSSDGVVWQNANSPSDITWDSGYANGGSAYSPIDSSMSDMANQSLQQSPQDQGVLSGIMMSGMQSLNGQGYASGGTTSGGLGGAAANLASAAPGQAYFAGNSAVVAGTPTYGFKPPTNADNATPIYTIGSKGGPSSTSTSSTGSSSSNPTLAQFTSALSNPTFEQKLQNQDNLFQLGLPGGASNPSLTPAAIQSDYAAYNSNPFSFNFAKGGGVQEMDSGGVPWDQNTQMMAESGGNPNAVSPVGAQGLMQLMPGTAASPGFGISPVQDQSPEENMRVGKEYGAAMMKKYGDPKLALMAYNWGPGNVDNWLSRGADPSKVPAETKGYVNKILGGGQVAGPSNGATAQPMSSHATPEDMQALESGMDSGKPINAMGMLKSGAGMMGMSPANTPSISDAINGPPAPPNMGKNTIPPPPQVQAQNQIKQPDSSALIAELDKNNPGVDKGLALSQAGFAMAAGRSPFALQNIGAGAEAGVQNYMNQKKAAGEYGLKEAEIKDRAQEMALQASRYQAMLNQGQEKVKQGQEKIDIQKGPEAAQAAKDLTGQDWYDSVHKSNVGYADYVRSISDGRAPMPSGFVLKTPYGQQLMGDVFKYDSTADGNRYANSKAFETGPLGNQVRSFNVGIAHLGTLDHLADALNNKDTQAINKMDNAFKSQFGSSAPTNFEAAKNIVGDEITKAVIGSKGALGDRESAQKVLDAANSPEQLRGVIATYKQLMAGQLGGLRQQYEQSVGGKGFDRFLSQDTEKELGKGNAQSIPQGWKPVGTLKGKQVYEDSQGKRHVEQ